MGNGIVPILPGFLEPHYRQVPGPGRFHHRMDGPQRAPPSDTSDHWSMFFDGSLNINGAGAEKLFISPNKDKLCYVLRILFPASNNVAEYKACLHGIRLAVKLGVKRLYVHGDSALVINQ